MSKRIKISFLESEWIDADATGTKIQGYEPALVRTSEGIKLGRVVDLKKLGEARRIEVLRSKTFVPIPTQ